MRQRITGSSIAWSVWCMARAGCVVLRWGVPCLVRMARLASHEQLNDVLVRTRLHKLYAGLAWAAGMHVRIIGVERLPVVPAVWVANHESSLDIPILGLVLEQRPHIWYALERFFRYPFLGSLLRRLAVPIDQTNAIKSGRALLQGVSRAQRESLSTVLFPEGGRYEDGAVHPFMPGFARIAGKLGQVIVPVYLEGLAEIFPPNAWVLRSQPWRMTTVTVRCGEPVIRREGESEDEFALRVFTWFGELSRTKGVD